VVAEGRMMHGHWLGSPRVRWWLKEGRDQATGWGHRKSGGGWSKDEARPLVGVTESPVVDEGRMRQGHWLGHWESCGGWRMRQGHWLGSVPCSFNALTLLVGRQKGHLNCKKTCVTNSRTVLLQKKWKQTEEPRSIWKTIIKLETDSSVNADVITHAIPASTHTIGLPY